MGPTIFQMLLVFVCRDLLVVTGGFETISEVKETRTAICKRLAAIQELTCHMGSRSVICHPAEVTIPPLPQPINAGTRFIDP